MSVFPKDNSKCSIKMVRIICAIPTKPPLYKPIGTINKLIQAANNRVPNNAYA